MYEDEQDHYIKRIDNAAERAANTLERIEQAQREWQQQQREQMILLRKEMKDMGFQVNWIALATCVVAGIAAVGAYKMWG